MILNYLLAMDLNTSHTIPMAIGTCMLAVVLLVSAEIKGK